MEEVSNLIILIIPKRSASLQALWSAHSKFKFGFGKQSGSLEGWLLTSTW